MRRLHGVLVAVVVLATAAGGALGMRDAAHRPAWAGPPAGMAPLPLPGVAPPAAPAAGPLIVHVWAASCPSCRVEMPLLARLAAATAAPLLGLNVGDPPADVVRWLAHYGNPFAAVYLDPDGKVSAANDVRFLPATFVLDRERRVVARMDGPLTDERLPQLLHVLRDRVPDVAGSPTH